MKTKFSGGSKASLIFAIFLLAQGAATIHGQHEGHVMPDQKKPAATPVAIPKPSPQIQTNKPPTAPDNETPVTTKAVDYSPEDAAGASLLTMDEAGMGIRIGDEPNNIVPMGQIGSGTSWLPASTPSSMLHKQSGSWLIMVHYNIFAGVNSQGGPRGVTKLESANWLMPMALRRLGKGTIELRSMISVEPFTFPPGGSPLLFQTGESYEGQPLIDRQHPHDLFMELSASYRLPLGEHGMWFTYLGYPGEPALGPTAFMHRASASENPSATLSHHLQDSSHISFGVFTTGFSYRWVKFEGSIFNGREPDENRYDFEAHPWRSRSIRLSVAPNRNWSFQISHGLLRDPEPLEPGDVRRTTASVSYNRPFKSGNWATSIIWGRNHESHAGERFNLNGYVAETTVNFLDKNYIYSRLELADKNSILRAADRQLLGITDHHPSFRIGAVTIGSARDIWNTRSISVALGGDLTFYSKPAILDAIYGNRPVSSHFFVRIRPAKMDMSHGPDQGSSGHPKH